MFFFAIFLEKTKMASLVELLKKEIQKASLSQEQANKLYHDSKITVLGCDPVVIFYFIYFFYFYFLYIPHIYLNNVFFFSKKVYDGSKSEGDYFFDSVSQKYMLDLFSYYASQSLGHNHPGLFDEEFLGKVKKKRFIFYCFSIEEYFRSFQKKKKNLNNV